MVARKVNLNAMCKMSVLVCPQTADLIEILSAGSVAKNHASEAAKKIRISTSADHSATLSRSLNG